MFEDKLASNHEAKQVSNLKKQGGWADDTPKPTIEKRLSTLRLGKQSSEDDVLPGLEKSSSQDEDMTLNNESINRAATFKELNEKSSNNLQISQILDGMDMKVLARNLLPESQLNEPDVPWSWDVLFAEIVPELVLHPKDAKPL